MKRWHVLVPDATAAKAVYDDLAAQGFSMSHVHVFGRDKAELKKAKVPPATEMEEAMIGGLGIGRLIAGVYGTTPPDPFIQKAESDIQAGQVLLVVGLPDADTEKLRGIIRAHPGARSPEVKD